MLTDTRIRTAKPEAKPYKLVDSHGLHLLVNPTGSKLWQQRYRFEGKERLTAFGPYPEVSLLEAREKRDALLKQVRERLLKKRFCRHNQLTSKRLLSVRRFLAY